MRTGLKFPILIASISMAAVIQPSLAAEDNIGLGLYLKPEFPGAEDYETVVLPSLDAEVGQIGISLKGVDLSLDLVPSPAVNAGLTIRYDEGRDDTESDETISLMTPVDPSAEYGLFVESGLPFEMLGVDDPALLFASANLRTTFGAGYGGNLFELKIGVLRELTPRLTTIAQLIMVHSDASYNRSYFGVSSADADITGLTQYTPGGAIKEFGATLIFNRHMGGHWYAGLITTATRLSSELAKSPVVEQHGSRTQWVSGLVHDVSFLNSEILPTPRYCSHRGLASCIATRYKQALARSETFWDFEDPHGPTLVQITDHLGDFTTPQRHSTSPASDDGYELLAVLFPGNW